MDLESLWTALDEHLLPLLLDYRGRLSALDVVEKSDRTLLSEADIAAQRMIVDTILEHYPDSGFVAEEDDEQLPRTGSPTWVVDPIDGTAEFLAPGSREYCSVVCRLDEGRPTGAYVLAPELATGGGPVRVHWAGQVQVNGSAAVAMPTPDVPARASVTRSRGTDARPFEAELDRIGSRVKLRTTSQTLDMLRTSIDVSDVTGAPQEQFDVFYRASQKIWDGAAGIGLSTAMGRLAVGTDGEDLLPFGEDLLAQREPTLAGSLVGAPGCVRWLVEAMRS
ncbi:inositol monophosphatase family protein [Kutzneria buriramensis]|uniref:3'(2'), 5'-bisphosphate nucleotidase n=1 Tax=Kutzneria buriramensis TaxID=1045776 RepID=A0A3E0HU76_9PSEU|nr:inositol monophosphatase family protein [Kutzneria buriramensis]REH50093.1 3'(2'), 5'-bisphosphate nucleotidase [Kutzneria buriramensis]